MAHKVDSKEVALELQRNYTINIQQLMELEFPFLAKAQRTTYVQAFLRNLGTRKVLQQLLPQPDPLPWLNVNGVNYLHKNLEQAFRLHAVPWMLQREGVAAGAQAYHEQSSSGTAILQVSPSTMFQLNPRFPSCLQVLALPLYPFPFFMSNVRSWIATILLNKRLLKHVMWIVKLLWQ